MLAKILQIFRGERNVPFFSFLIGLGISVMLFHRPIHTTLALALPVDEVETNIIKKDGKCFKYVAEDSRCEILSSK